MVVRLISPRLSGGVKEYVDGQLLEVSEFRPRRDPMYDYAPELYWEAGRTALQCVRAALRDARAEPPRAVLDYACGYGRIMRWLRAAFPSADLTACDLYETMVGFCQRQFGATPVIANLDPAKVELGLYDLIWSGSLLSHIDRGDWPGFLDLFRRSLSPGGVAVFTTMGAKTVDDLRSRENTMRFTEEQLEQVLRDYDESGFGFWPTINAEWNHGDCVVSQVWVDDQLARAGLVLVSYTETAWLGQDVIAVQPLANGTL